MPIPISPHAIDDSQMGADTPTLMIHILSPLHTVFFPSQHTSDSYKTFRTQTQAFYVVNYMTM